MKKTNLSAAVLSAALAAPALADVDLLLVPLQGTAQSCDTFLVELRAAASGKSDEEVSSASAVFSWDPAALKLLSYTHTPGLPLTMAMIAPDPTGLNEADPPADGDAFVVGYSGLTQNLTIPGGGRVVLGVLEFQALDVVGATSLDFLPAAGPGLVVTTEVLGPTIGPPITGSLVGSSVQVLLNEACDPDPCPADVNGDLAVNVQDIIVLFIEWGTDDADADINADGVVGVEDIIEIVANWGTCGGEE